MQQVWAFCCGCRRMGYLIQGGLWWLMVKVNWPVVTQKPLSVLLQTCWTLGLTIKVSQRQVHSPWLALLLSGRSGALYPPSPNHPAGQRGSFISYWPWGTPRWHASASGSWGSCRELHQETWCLILSQLHWTLIFPYKVYCQSPFGFSGVKILNWNLIICHFFAQFFSNKIPLKFQSKRRVAYTWLVVRSRVNVWAGRRRRWIGNLVGRNSGSGSQPELVFWSNPLMMYYRHRPICLDGV